MITSTEGNPFFVEEFLKSLINSGDIFKEIAVPSELPFFNWHDLIVTRSHNPSG